MKCSETCGHKKLKEYWISHRRPTLVHYVDKEISEKVARELHEPRVLLDKPQDPHNWTHVVEVEE